MTEPLSTETLEAYFADNLPRHLDLLKEMVKINSFTANPEGVNALGKMTAMAFAPLGFTADTVQSAMLNYGQHLILTKPGRTQQTIGFVSHLDTVFPSEEEIRNNFAWREEGDKIYGPGTVDIKGGTVMMLMILEAIQKFQPQVFADTTWVLLLDASEEAEAEDFGALCRERLADATACLVFEGGNKTDNDFQIVVTRKGMAVYEISVEGKAAHAGTSHPKGANAIVQMAHTIQDIANLTDYQKHLTFNVGTINGGTVTNRVPHQAQAKGEMRTFSPEIFEAAIAELLTLKDKAIISDASRDYHCQVEVEIVRKTPPWPRNEGTDRLFTLWQKTAETLGYQVLPEERGGLSDGNHFWHAIPTLDGLGPSGGNAHCSEQSDDGSKEQEYVSVSSFVPKALLNTTALLKLLNGNHPG